MATPGPSSSSQSIRQAHSLPSEAYSLAPYGRPTPLVADTEIFKCDNQRLLSPPTSARRGPLGGLIPLALVPRKRGREHSPYSSVIHRQGRFRSVAAREVLENAQHAITVTTSTLLNYDTASPLPSMQYRIIEVLCTEGDPLVIKLDWICRCERRLARP